MAKFEELFDDIQELFSEVISITGLEHLVNFKVITNDKLRVIGKVQKTNDMVKYLTNGIDVVITINQLIFNQLPQEMQEMVAIELLTGVSFGSGKDVVVIGKQDVSTYSGVLKKYGYDEYEKLQLSIKSLYDKKQNEENIVDTQE